MTSDRSLLVPLHSNAKALVAGAPIQRVRARLKHASLLYDTVLLEDGTLYTQAGPGGSSSMHHRTDPAEARWQTAASRSEGQRSEFVLAVGSDSGEGPPTSDMHVVVQSSAEISWAATLQPFRRELPAECDWIDFVGLPRVSGELRTLMQRWIRRDRRNPVLLDRLQTDFVRNRVIDDANGDLAAALWGGVALSADPLHQEVLSGRLTDGSGWSPTGWVLPVVVPEVADLTWTEVAELRSHKSIRSFRDALADIENAVLAAASDADDLAQLAESEYVSRIRTSALDVGDVRSTMKTSLRGLVIGSLAGLAVMGISGPIGALLGASAGAAVGVPFDLATMSRKRQSRDWIAFDDHLRSATSRT